MYTKKLIASDDYQVVDVQVFSKYLTLAGLMSPLIAMNTIEATELDQSSNAMYFLSKDNNSGFGITSSKEIVALFSTVKGRGAELLTSAVTNGAQHLNCFDGYLVGLYASFGFEEVRRVPNNYGRSNPDIVYMQLNKQSLAEYSYLEELMCSKIASELKSDKAADWKMFNDWLFYLYDNGTITIDEHNKIINPYE